MRNTLLLLEPNCVYVAWYVVSLIDVDQETFIYEDQQNGYGTKPAIRQRRKILGNYYDIFAASCLGVDKLMKIVVKFYLDEE